jgi:hypothetical protein
MTNASDTTQNDRVANSEGTTNALTTIKSCVSIAVPLK